MTSANKRLARLYSIPSDLTWDELVATLDQIGFRAIPAAGGSGYAFIDNVGRKIIVHRPHPGNLVKRYVIRKIVNLLKS